MKALFFIAALFALTNVYGQSKETLKTKTTYADTAKPKQLVYAVILNQNDLSSLLNFIANANMYSQDGRNAELDELRKHIVILPSPEDSTKVKPKK